MPKEFLTTANATFTNLQSGVARPYFYIEAIISGVTSVLGDSYTSTNWIIDGGEIDREKPILPGERSSIFSADVTIKCDNSTQRFSPDVTGSVFFGNDYLDSTINYWAGFLDVGLTAVLLQRGSFLLSNLRLDSRQTVAYMRLKDRFKRALDSKIGRLVSGTAAQYVATGIVDGSNVLQQLFITGAGLTAGDLDLASAGQSFNNISFSEQSVAEAAALIAEASDGYLFTSRRGILNFRSNAPIFGTAPSADFTIRESDWARNIFWEETKDDRLNHVSMEILSGTSIQVSIGASGITARSKILTNDAIQNTGDAVAIISRFLDRFSGQLTRLEIDTVWAPTLELGNSISVFSTGLGLLGKNFEIYRIQERTTEGNMRLFLVDQDRSTGKWGFFSDQSATVCGTVFTGGPGESGGWQAGFAFFGRTTGTATNPGFDLDGNNNNAINTSVTSSGAGGTGIEVPFMYY